MRLWPHTVCLVVCKRAPGRAADRPLTCDDGMAAMGRVDVTGRAVHSSPCTLPVCVCTYACKELGGKETVGQSCMQDI